MIRACSFGIALACAWPAMAGPASYPTTPLGITLQKVKRSELSPVKGAPTAPVVANFGDREPPAVIFANAEGKTLYAYAADAGEKPVCDRGAEWQVLEATGAPAGDWSMVPCGTARQWAYRGQPLYTSAKDTKVGEAKGVTEKWRAVIYNPAADLAHPANVTIRAKVKSVDAPVFADTGGFTLYTYDGDKVPNRATCTDTCVKTWRPFAAPQIAKPVGDWTVVNRADGRRQWAYRGKPLYLYQGDTKPGDASGDNLDGQWHAAALTQPFTPPGVTSARIALGFMAFVASDGKTLYARDNFRYSTGGHSINDGPPPAAEVGRAIGVNGCDETCVKDWPPLLAAADAQSTGYWSVVARADGRKQWAYQGYPLYTYSGDRIPGDAFGLDVFTYTSGAAAMYWRVATP
jgi:predicted lipoprotein with Yx(FWY)xxD motif